MKTTKMILLCFISILVFSCTEDEIDKINNKDTLNPDTNPTIEYTNLAISIQQPSKDFTVESISKVAVIATNINSGKKDTIQAKAIDNMRVEVKLAQGFYKLEVSGEMSYLMDKKSQTIQFQGYVESTKVLGQDMNLDLPTYIKSSKGGDFVLAEIFFAGTQTDEGKKYRGDTYFVIYNNSSETKYADGIVLMESAFMTVSKYNYTPDVMDSKFTVEALYKIPGDGTQYPVKAGGSLVICDRAIDHTAANTHSFDLSKADFEWYDDSSSPRIADTDNPAVPNLEKIFCYSPTIWAPHDRGFHSYAIGRLPEAMTHDNYLTQQAYHYTYDMVIGGKTYPCERDKYTFPNDWILDAVNLSIQAKYEWIITSPTLDAGWSYCGTVDRDATRYGKSVRRKVIATDVNGKKILKDTNNSTNDFEAEQTANPYYFK